MSRSKRRKLARAGSAKASRQPRVNAPIGVPGRPDHVSRMRDDGMLTKRGLRPRVTPAQLVVLSALRVACIARHAVVPVDDVAAALLPKDRDEIGARTALELTNYLSGALYRLGQQGLAFSPGVVGRRRFWGHPDVLPRTAPLPAVPSGLDRVADATRRLALRLGRGVFPAEIATEVHEEDNRTSERDPLRAHRPARATVATNKAPRKGRGEGLQSSGNDTVAAMARPLTTQTIYQFVRRLVRQGRLKSLYDPARPETLAQRILYVPGDFDAEQYRPTTPIDWPTAATAACEHVWREELAAADAEHRRPRPFTTAQVVAALKVVAPGLPEFHDPTRLPGVLQQLAKKKRAYLRRVERPGARRLLWLPVSVKKPAVSTRGAFASDPERAEEALRRALARSGVPAVPRAQIEREIERDSALTMSRGNSLAMMLEQLTTRGGERGPGRRPLGHRVVMAVGRVSNRPYYALDEAPATLAYVRALSLRARWRSVGLAERVSTLSACQLPTVALGRMRLIDSELATVDAEAATCLRDGGPTVATLLAETIEALREVRAVLAPLRVIVERRVEQARGAGVALRREHPSMPPAVLAATAYARLTAPLWGAARNTAAQRPSIGREVLRIQNQRFTGSRAPDEIGRCLFALDQASALMYAAVSWGGPHCRASAEMARAELELVRDPRFVLPDVDDPSIGQRLAAVSCLAFLGWRPGSSTGIGDGRWAPEAQPLAEVEVRLRTAALSDPAPGVRRAALWAYGFAGADDPVALLQTALDDPSHLVRVFARETLLVVAASPTGWWLV